MIHIILKFLTPTHEIKDFHSTPRILHFWQTSENTEKQSFHDKALEVD